MATRTTLLTAEEFMELPLSRWTELIDGVIVELSPPAGGHGKRQAKIIRLLGGAEDEGPAMSSGNWVASFAAVRTR
jgi:Uma2 family endonuclease